MGKRILITSIPSWNKKFGSNTWSSLFYFADPSDVANIYIDNKLPDSEVASRYFNIREIDVIKSNFQRNLPIGKETACNLSESAYPANNSTISERHKSETGLLETIRTTLTKRHWKIFQWVREVLWKTGKWNSPELKKFISDFDPDVFVFSIESYLYFNRLNEYIIDHFKPSKVIAYMWDDNFTYKQSPHNAVEKIERYFLRKQVKRLIDKSDSVLAIGPKMKKELDAEYKICSKIITKPLLSDASFIPYKAHTPIRLLYTGKLIIGREQTIAKLVRAIQTINSDGIKVILDIYTTTDLSAKRREQLEIPGCCVLHPPVPQNKVFELQRQADVLIFPESLDCRNLSARLSFSTKLTDYFSAGKCIWAIGNADLGPIDYIRTEDAGLVSSDESSIQETLKLIVNNPDIITEFARKSFECGQNNHNRENILNTLKHDIIQY